MTPAVLIAGGLVADGTGAEPIARDVLVRDGVVVDLLTPGAAVEAERLDATGMLVAPGFVDTEMARAVLDGPGGDAIRAQSPFGRVATVDEVAEAVAYFTEPRAAWSSGAILDVNGASYLRS